MIENLLVAEELIIERLENTIDDIKILSTADLSGVTERSQIIPAIHVVYAGYKLETEGQQSQSMAFIRQKWITMIVDRDIRSIKNGKTISPNAGIVHSQIIKSLFGYQLSPDHSFMRLESPQPPRYANNFAYYPIPFSTKIQLEGFLI